MPVGSGVVDIASLLSMLEEKRGEEGAVCVVRLSCCRCQEAKGFICGWVGAVCLGSVY